MKQWLCSIPLVALLSLSTDVEAWGKPRYPLETAAQDGPGAKEFPLRQDQGWYVKESLLVWHPYEDDVDFGARYKNESDLDFKLEPEAPNFKWGTGARLAIGRYLPKHQLWDVSLTTTYFYGTAHKSASATDSNSFMISSWSPALLGESITKGSASWHLNYFTWDLGFGRNFFMTPTIVIHPHLDLRAALMYQDYTNKNTNLGAKTSLSSNNNMWGVGPRFGTDVSYNFKTNWSFVGNFSASLLYARFNTKSNMNGFLSSLPASLNNSQSYNMVAPNLEAALGMGWEDWVNNDTIRIAMSLLFEGVQWFNMNRLFHMNSQNITFNGVNVPYAPATHNAGDLRFFGFSFNLQVDF